jgi:hypothetical protein
MPVSRYGIIYSTGNMHIRSWFFLDDDSHYENLPVLRPGEAYQLMPAGLAYSNASEMMNALGKEARELGTHFVAHHTRKFADALGKSVGDPHCAVVNKQGQVVAFIMADPDLDTYHDDPSCQLVLEPTHTAQIGWSWTEAGGFARP